MKGKKMRKIIEMKKLFSEVLFEKDFVVSVRGILRIGLLTCFGFMVMAIAATRSVSAYGPPSDGGGGGEQVSWDEVLHDSRSDSYRNPGWGTSAPYRTGAVPVDTTVTLRIRAKADNLTKADIRVWDNDASSEIIIPMSISSSDAAYDYWEGTVTFNKPVDTYYAFCLTAGDDVDWYQDDAKQDGGVGEMTDNHTYENDYSIVWHTSNFTTPSWHKDAVIYEIMVDGFYNGNADNDPAGNSSSGDVAWWEWDSNGDGKFDRRDSQRSWIYKKPWGEERAHGNDFYGGDFQGIKTKLPYLSDLGVTAIYFTPWYESPDYHGYAVNDYKSVHPYYGVIGSRLKHDTKTDVVINDTAGSLAVFDDMRTNLNAAGIKVISDQVLNHTGAQSLYFQRFEHINPDLGVHDYYPNDDGAYESESSYWIDWFQFNTWNHDYQAWWGYKNIPEIKYVRDGTQTTALNDLVSGSNSVFDFWHGHEVEGYRLDVNNEYEDEQNSRLVNREIRKKVKGLNSDAVIISEIWGEASPWLAGDMSDATMDYRFRSAVIDWAKDTTTLTTDNFNQRLLVLQENYPVEAQYANWSLLGSHDTDRIQTVLGSAEKQRLAAIIQFTHIGPPMIWYGDEIGMTGGGDPKNRTSMDWGSVDGNALLDFYKALISARNNNLELRQGWIVTLLVSTDVYAYGREVGEGTSAEDAVVAVNRSTSSQSVTIDVSPLPELQAGETLTDQLTGTNYTVSDNFTIDITVPATGGAILTQ